MFVHPKRIISLTANVNDFVYKLSHMCINIYVGPIYLDDTITWEKIIQEKWNY